MLKLGKAQTKAIPDKHGHVYVHGRSLQPLSFSATVFAKQRQESSTQLSTTTFLKNKTINNLRHARYFFRISVSDRFVAQSVFVACGRFDVQEIIRGAIGVGRHSHEQCWW